MPGLFLARPLLGLVVRSKPSNPSATPQFLVAFFGVVILAPAGPPVVSFLLARLVTSCMSRWRNLSSVVAFFLSNAVSSSSLWCLVICSALCTVRRAISASWVCCALIELFRKMETSPLETWRSFSRARIRTSRAATAFGWGWAFAAWDWDGAYRGGGGANARGNWFGGCRCWESAGAWNLGVDRPAVLRGRGMSPLPACEGCEFGFHLGFAGFNDRGGGGGFGHSDHVEIPPEQEAGAEG